MEKSTPGKIFTFYSYKGGTGRSMAVANYACWLVRRLSVPSQRVLLMDWDLEAPGLHRFFHEKTGEPENSSRPGVINYFDEIYRKLELETGLSAIVAADQNDRAFTEQFPLDEYLIRDVVSGVDLLKAGRLDQDYAQLVSKFDWITFYSKYGGLLNTFRNWIESNYTFCLIDSRTGFNDISGICTMLMPEKLVTVFTPNRQNVNGVLDLTERAVNYRRASGDFRPLAVFPLPSRIENAELELKKKWREDYQKEFETKLKSIYQLDACDLSEYFDKIQLPHVSYYAYGEEIALLKETRGDSLSLSGAYEQFFLRLTDLETAWDKADEMETTEKAPRIVPPAAETEEAVANIFISYAHTDDQSLLEEQKGWVTTFRQALETRLFQLLGAKVSIWTDQTLSASEYLPEAIENQIRKSDIFIPILSPRYVRSNFAERELNQFYRAAEMKGGPTVGNMSQIFKVNKTPIAPNEEPPELRNQLGYNFYEMDELLGRPREFTHFLGAGSDFKFWNKIDDLAFDIKRVIEELKEPSTGPVPSLSLERPSVYLAETTADVSFERDNIKRDLQQYEYKVFPDRVLPVEATSFRAAVKEQLSRCSLSIHLLGERYGVIPEGEETRSIIHIQEELAADHAQANPSFSRIIWMAPQTSPTDPRHEQFVHSLQVNLSAGTEFLQTSFEDLKTRILEKLSRAKQPQSTPTSGDLIRVYLVSDSADAGAVQPIEQYLFDRGYEVISSLAEGEGAQAMQYHRENLLNCDAVFIYYGTGSQQWLRSQLWDLQKVKGWGRTKPMRATAIIIGAPRSPEKNRFKTREASVVWYEPDADPAITLEPFIAQLGKAPY